jgi:hypothetical protein
VNRAILINRAILLIALGLAAVSVSALQTTSPEPLTGTWTLISVDNVLPDGTRVQPYGPQPKGILMFDAGGRYALQIFRSSRASFASNDKSRGTAEEYKATVEGTNSHFGRYSVDAASRTISFQIEHASFPNWEGTEQKRSFTREGDELRYTVPATTTGGAAVGEVAWRRVR